ncbi:hypothetical protein MLD38_003957 [Melastoma candidum]|uniref:Uncharacterized protein n=1 Tax=Melastoma candidum TaxID=119954 RepID=A0ACB9S644_9MYRT|nr:hypothetical protein MLD38_003957 [Melastoma candidum]
MEAARRHLSVTEEESKKVSGMVVPPHKSGEYPSFYENLSLRGLQIHSARPGLISCSFKVPPHLTDRSGNFAAGAIANLVDEIGYAAVYVEGTPMSVSVNMSISYLSPAKAHDELEITSKALGRRGSYSGTLVVLRNKQTGEVVAEGRHSLFAPPASKI